jgi:hypothetical protein
MKHLLGSTIQIDPSFPYYRNRSEASIAEEIELAGYRVVRYFVTDETNVNAKLVDAFHRRGISVWAMTLGNGMYTTAHLPADWPDWQMVLLKPIDDGFYRFSMFSDKYARWKKAALAKLVRDIPFDGLEIAEPYFPEWNGLSNGVYGDIGPYARAAFRKRNGTDIPDFKHKSSSMYYKTNKAVYRAWVDFRVDAVNCFLNELINGAGGVRDSRPGTAIATWSLALKGSDALDKLKEYQGIDAVEMISRVRPDLHFLQTHWPDWMKPYLKPNYFTDYKPFVDRIRAVHPNIPLGIQADIGSKRSIRRSREWLDRFNQTAKELRYATWTAYEYHIGKYMYSEKPAPLRSRRIDNRLIELIFNKVIDPSSAAQPGSFRFLANGSDTIMEARCVRVDGNRAEISSEHFPESSFSIHVSNVQDTPSLWLLQGEKPNTVAEDTAIEVGRA